MEFRRIEFKDRATQRVYDNYIKQIQKQIKSLPKADQEDILMEMNSYIFEGIRADKSGDELNTLLNIIDNFGDLEIILSPILRDKKVRKTTSSFNPGLMVKNFVLTVRKGAFIVLVSLGYIILGAFGLSSLTKLIFQEEVGMFYKPEEYFVLAGFYGNAVNEAEYELLGNWYLPIMLLGMALSYYLIKQLIRFEQSLINRDELRSLLATVNR